MSEGARIDTGMNGKAFKQVSQKILNDPELRQAYYDQSQQLRAERAERELRDADKIEQKEREFEKRLWRDSLYKPPGIRPTVNLLAMPAAEAWIFESPAAVQPEEAATRGELRYLLMMERMRLK